MLKITLEQWRMFVAVVEYGGFNQASQGVHKSQSSIHSAVNKVEQVLGLKLFTVKGRRTKLTEAGELMLTRANHLLEEATRIETMGSKMAEGVESKLRIAVDAIFPPNLLYKVLDKVSTEFPFLRIELIESVLSGATELLEQGDVDIAITPFVIDELFSEELCQLKFVAVASPDHPLHQYQQNITLDTLKDHRQIVVRDSAVSRKKDVGWLKAEQRWTVSHLRTSIDMIIKGFGFAWLPTALIEAELINGSLKPLPLQTDTQRKAQLHLVVNDQVPLGPASRTFLGELRYQCMQLPTEENTNL